MLRFALFDLDNTIYPQESGLLPAIGGRINDYMVERLGYPAETVHESRDKYYRAFGTTLNALRHRYGIDEREFLDFVHDLPIDHFLQPSRELDETLDRLPLRKVIFTNADSPHAERVLARLGVARHFERIIDILTLDFVNKPDERAYHRVLELLGAEGHECMFVEDSAVNLVPAKRLGMVTVLVDGDEPAPEVDCRIHRVEEVGSVFDRLVQASLPRPS
jgi:putative hydrolase of the HAD superfamily